MEKYWTNLCLFLQRELKWSPREVISLVKQRQKIIDRWKRRNETLILIRMARLNYSPGYYSLGKKE